MKAKRANSQVNNENRNMAAAIPERREPPREKIDYSSSYDLNDREVTKKEKWDA